MKKSYHSTAVPTMVANSTRQSSFPIDPRRGVLAPIIVAPCIDDVVVRHIGGRVDGSLAQMRHDHLRSQIRRKSEEAPCPTHVSPDYLRVRAISLPCIIETDPGRTNGGGGLRRPPTSLRPPVPLQHRFPRSAGRLGSNCSPL